MSSSSTLEKSVLILKSSDGDEFELEKSIAMESSITIKNMVEDDVATNIISLPNVEIATLFKIVKYLEKHATEISDSNNEEIKNYDQKLVSTSFKSLLEIVLAAKYLEIKTLHELCTQEVAKRIKNKSSREILKEFDNITCDFTREKDIAIYKEFAWAFEGDDIDGYSTLRDITTVMLFIALPFLYTYVLSRLL